MKKIVLLIVFFVIAANTNMVRAQENEKVKKEKSDEIITIFKKGHHTNGAYGSLWAGYTQVDKHNGFSYGINGARLINHVIGIGFSITGFSNEYFLGHEAGSVFQSLQGAYAGLLVEPIVIGRSPVHVSFPCTFGIGGVAELEAHYWDYYDNTYYYKDSDLYFVAEPGVDVELNIVKHLRIAVGAKYRITSATHLTGFSTHALNGYSISVALKFGKF